jgi:hypothetical protein
MLDCIIIKGRRIREVHVLIVCVIIIILYGQFLERVVKKPDRLTSKFAKCNGCDYWGILHTLFFTLLGFLFPNQHLKYLMLGILWEVIEAIIGCVNSGDVFINLFGGWGVKTKENSARFGDAWYYGRLSDVFFNTVGYNIGSSLRNNMAPNLWKTCA